jgi:putative ABC transport system permease protein
VSGPIELAPWQIGAAAGLLLVNGLLSVWLRLGLERTLAIASARTVGQLALLGVVLEPVFAAGNPWLVGAICLGMIALAAREAANRSSRSFPGIVPSSLLALLVAGGGTAILGTAAIIQVDPWWEPRYLIPMLGMILGNGLTGISLGLDRCLQQLDEHRGRVEALLAFGAEPWEASRALAAEALRAGMVPILNSMSVVGLVTIPGMMTGQILGGTPPLQAAAYQMLILFLIAAATGLGALVSILLAVRAVFDEAGRLRPERIVRTAGR